MDMPIPDRDREHTLVRATFDSAPDGLVIIDRDGHPLLWNARFAAMWRFPQAMLERADGDAMRQHVRERIKEPAAYDRANRRIFGSTATQLVDEIERLDGRVFERHVSPLLEAGFDGCVVVRWRDISARRRAEVTLARTRERLAAVFENAVEAILLADDQARYIEANPAACRLLGRPRDELLRLTVGDVFGGDLQAFQAQWSEFLRVGRSSGLVPLRRPGGAAAWGRFNAVARIQPGVHLSVVIDVTDEEQARQRLAETAAQMETAMAAGDVVFWSVDLGADRVGAADASWLQRTLGYSAEEIGTTIASFDALVHPDDFERREAAWQALVEGRSDSFEAEFRLRHRDGRWLWMLARGRATERDASGRARRVVGTRIDITRRRQAEAQLEEQAYTDGLTGALTRRRFLDLATAEMARAQRHREPLALLMLDLDHFKQVNDRFGHAGGDAVLCAFVTGARQLVRSSDLLGRLGGEEFAVLLPHTDTAGAMAMAERLRQQWRSQQVPLGGGSAGFTVSIGVAVWPDVGGAAPTPDALISAADGALYRAKHEGRDTVRLAAQD